jgi:subtilisin family serine protease
MRWFGTFLLLMIALVGATWTPPRPPVNHAITAYDAARYPHVQCLAGRVLAETDPRLTAEERTALWREYGLTCSFEWVAPADGFTYHELEVRAYPLPQRLWAALTRRALPPRALNRLVPLLGDDPRVHWAAPDALLLEWSGKPTLAPGLEWNQGLDDLKWKDRDVPAEAGAADAAVDGTEAGAAPAKSANGSPGVLPGTYGAALLTPDLRHIISNVSDWAAQDNAPAPWPDFEYYRLCPPQGVKIDWAPELAGNPVFAARAEKLYGTGQQQALDAYCRQGSPALKPVTICVADTGVQLNHPDLKGRLHPNSIDANYRSYIIAAPCDRPRADEELRNRDDLRATGLPRLAIQSRPAAHGTEVAGLAARCTAGFLNADGADAVRLLPASIKSDKAVAFTGWRVKSPISSFIKLVYCLSENYPTGSFTPAPDSRVQNTGDVRVVSISGSVPKSYFSEAEWRVVANVVGKAAGSIAEDLRHNDRVYVFAAGNDAQPEPNRPCEQPYVLGVAAAMACDGSQGWVYTPSGEGTNMGAMLVAAPGDALISSTIFASPNLAYLPGSEFMNPIDNFAIPPRAMTWQEQTNHFNATSGATPQVSALAALLYAQQPQRSYPDVITAIKASTECRALTAPWGRAQGLISYPAALGW